MAGIGDVQAPYVFDQNVLLRHPAKSGIKVIDFGSSCFEHEKGPFLIF